MPSFASRSLVALLVLAATPVLAVGEPAFLTGPQAGAHLDLATRYLHAHAADHGLSFADLADLEVTNHYVTKHNGTTHVYWRQRHDGIPVFLGMLQVNVARNGSIINFNSLAVPNLAGKVNTTAASISPEAAVRSVADHLGIAAPESLLELEAVGGPTRGTTFAPSGISRDEIPVSLMYQPTEKAGVRLVWRVVVSDRRNENWWESRVDAVTGAVIGMNNFTDHGAGTNCYDVIPLPAADPNDVGGDTQTVCDPYDSTASPFGWHDSNGVAGAEFTDTRGNNVHAQEDIDNTDTGGARPDGGANLVFDADWDPSLDPEDGENIDASITNLFYYNNIMHDVTYHYGFDEPAGNFQTNNYGNGGLGNDHVFADALDGFDVNNANFGTPADGLNPRMQMFRWLYPFSNEVVIDAPAGLAGSYQASSAAFGPAATTTGVTGNIVVMVDATGPDFNDGCEAPTNAAALVGNIALANRGNCNFTIKVKNAQVAGATAALVKKITAGGPAVLGGTDATITIPAAMVSQATGNAIIAAPSTVHGTFRALTANPEPDRDSDFDNGIMAHEYGHGISNRLIGGPLVTGCIFGTERMGEGLSDFWTVLLSPLPSDTASTPRGVGTYTIFEGRDGLGIRAFPYSTSLTVNPQLLSNIDDPTVTQPHGVGSIWMSMAFEVYQELVARHGLDMDLYTGTGGNNLFMQLIIDAMKLVGCGPTFESLRDAILLADQNLTSGANRCEIWRGFAKRGLGTGADSGTTDVGNEVENFSIPNDCSAKTNYMFDDGFETANTSRWTATSP